MPATPSAIGSAWSGFGPAPSISDLSDWATDYSPTSSGGQLSNPWTNAHTSEAVNWWMGPNVGVTFEPSGCQGARCLPFEECRDCDEADDFPALDENCFDSIPDLVTFKPFYIYKGAKTCGPEQPDDVRRRWLKLKAQLESQRLTQVARQFSIELANRSTSLSPVGSEATTPEEGLGTLMRARATLGLHGGALVVPYYALPRLQRLGLIQFVNGRYIGPAQIPVITDAGIRNGGPSGVTVPNGGAWMYYIDQPPVFAIHPRVTPVANDNVEDIDFLRVFGGNSLACDCPLGLLRKQPAIVAFNPCASFAVAIDLRKDGPGLVTAAAV